MEARLRKHDPREASNRQCTHGVISVGRRAGHDCCCGKDGGTVGSTGATVQREVRCTIRFRCIRHEWLVPVRRQPRRRQIQAAGSAICHAGATQDSRPVWQWSSGPYFVSGSGRALHLLLWSRFIANPGSGRLRHGAIRDQLLCHQTIVGVHCRSCPVANRS